jgi:hypothetical protein
MCTFTVVLLIFFALLLFARTFRVAFGLLTVLVLGAALLALPYGPGRR